MGNVGLGGREAGPANGESEKERLRAIGGGIVRHPSTTSRAFCGLILLMFVASDARAVSYEVRLSRILTDDVIPERKVVASTAPVAEKQLVPRSDTFAGVLGQRESRQMIRGSADRGQLRAFSESSAEISSERDLTPGFNSSASGVAIITFTVDDLVVSAPPLFDEPLVTFTVSPMQFDVTGDATGSVDSNNTTGSATAFAEAQVRFFDRIGSGGPTELGYRAFRNKRVRAVEGIFEPPVDLLIGQPAGEPPPEVTVQWGQPFGMEMELIVSATASLNEGPGTFNARMDASSTFSFPTDVPVFNLPDGFTVTSADAGIVDGFWQGPLIPEPATLGLMTMGLMTIGGLALLRRC